MNRRFACDRAVAAQGAAQGGSLLVQLSHESPENSFLIHTQTGLERNPQAICSVQPTLLSLRFFPLSIFPGIKPSMLGPHVETVYFTHDGCGKLGCQATLCDTKGARFSEEVMVVHFGATKRGPFSSTLHVSCLK